MTTSYYYMQVRSSGQYLNILNGSMTNGSEACQGTSNTTNNFLWEIIPATDGYFFWRVGSSGQYLNILNGSTANGALACQGTNNTTSNFLWQFVLPETPSNVVPAPRTQFYLKVKSSGQYLNILNASTANGAEACQGTNNTTPNFLWELIPATGGRFFLQVKSSGQYLNILNASTANGAMACQGANNTTNNFLWEIIPATGGYFFLRVVSSGQYLNIINASTANGAAACQGANNTTPNFLWQFVLPEAPSNVVPAAGVQFHLKVKSSGQYLNILNASTANGAVACQGTNDTTPNFSWELFPGHDPVLPNGPTATGSEMLPGQVLHPGDSIRSPSGQYTLVMQADGNLVLYKANNIPLWDSNTAGPGVAVCIMQGDGNLVIYDGNAKALWASNTAGIPNNYLRVQDDGNTVIFSAAGNRLWATNTVPDFALALVPSTVTITPGATVNVSAQTTVISGKPDSIGLTNAAGPTPRPAFLSGTLANGTIVAPGSSLSFSISASANAVPGSYPFVIQGVAAPATHTATTTVHIAKSVDSLYSVTLTKDTSSGTYSYKETTSATISSLLWSMGELPTGVSMVFTISHTDSKGKSSVVQHLSGNTATSAFNSLDLAGEWTAILTLQQPPTGLDYTPESVTLLVTANQVGP